MESNKIIGYIQYTDQEFKDKDKSCSRYLYSAFVSEQKFSIFIIWR
jgi:hypothetical protein